MRRSNQSKKAFTIVELLTVMGVIAMLIGLLVPSLNLVRTKAKEVRERAQLHTIEVGLEMYKNEYKEYPKSEEISGTGGVITGSQRMAEALVGRDMQGFDPETTWHPATDTIAYATSGDPMTESLERRQGPYLKLENVGVFNIDQLYPGATTKIYGETTTNSTTNKPAPFITDVFQDKQIQITVSTSTGNVTKNVKSGTPILYFRANEQYKNIGLKANTSLFSSRTYNYDDNRAILAMGRMMNNDPANPLYEHKWHTDTTGVKFYESIRNPQIPTDEGVAYKADSFILISAGKDGFFGTADDITNYDD